MVSDKGHVIRKIRATFSIKLAITNKTVQTISVDEAQTHLPNLIEAAVACEKIFIARDGLSVQLVPQTPAKRKRTFESARRLIQMAPDFDEPLEDFKEYME